MRGCGRPKRSAKKTQQGPIKTNLDLEESKLLKKFLTETKEDRLSFLERLEQKYVKSQEDSDIIDLKTLTIIKDCGMLKSMRAREFGARCSYFSVKGRKTAKLLRKIISIKRTYKFVQKGDAKYSAEDPGHLQECYKQIEQIKIENFEKDVINPVNTRKAAVEKKLLYNGRFFQSATLDSLIPKKRLLPTENCFNLKRCQVMLQPLETPICDLSLAKLNNDCAESNRLKSFQNASSSVPVKNLHNDCERNYRLQSSQNESCFNSKTCQVILQPLETPICDLSIAKLSNDCTESNQLKSFQNASSVSVKNLHNDCTRNYRLRSFQNEASSMVKHVLTNFTKTNRLIGNASPLSPKNVKMKNVFDSYSIQGPAIDNLLLGRSPVQPVKNIPNRCHVKQKPLKPPVYDISLMGEDESIYEQVRTRKADYFHIEIKEEVDVIEEYSSGKINNIESKKIATFSLNHPKFHQNDLNFDVLGSTNSTYLNAIKNTSFERDFLQKRILVPSNNVNCSRESVFRFSNIKTLPCPSFPKRFLRSKLMSQ